MVDETSTPVLSRTGYSNYCLTACSKGMFFMAMENGINPGSNPGRGIYFLLNEMK